MNEELKPCPFCMADEVSAHQPDCYFTLRYKGAMRSELTKAWNRRAPTVTNASASAAPGASDDLDYLLAYIPNVAARAAAQRKVSDLRAQLALAGQCGARQEPVAYMIRDKRESARFLLDGAKWKPCSVEDYELRKEHTDIFEFRALIDASPVSAQGTPDGWRNTIDTAAGYLEHYAKYCYEVKPDEIERHPYIPAIEQVAEELRSYLAAAPAQAQASAQPASGSDVGAGGQS